MARVPSIRASDADREQVAERLRHATVEGRLSTDELEERLEATSAARTYGELDMVVADLPVSRPLSRPGVRVPRWVTAVAAATLVLGVFGMLASAAGHVAERVGEGTLAHWHHLVIAAASMAAVLAVVVLCATVVTCGALLRRLQRSRTSHGLNRGRGYQPRG